MAATPSTYVSSEQEVLTALNARITPFSAHRDPRAIVAGSATVARSRYALCNMNNTVPRQDSVPDKDSALRGTQLQASADSCPLQPAQRIAVATYEGYAMGSSTSRRAPERASFRPGDGPHLRRPAAGPPARSVATGITSASREPAACSGLNVFTTRHTPDV